MVIEKTAPQKHVLLFDHGLAEAIDGWREHERSGLMSDQQSFAGMWSSPADAGDRAGELQGLLWTRFRDAEECGTETNVDVTRPSMHHGHDGGRG